MGNLQKGYARIIDWISEIWREFDRMIIISSFDYCGITDNQVERYHLHLRHFVQNNELARDIIDDDDGTNDLNGFGEYQSDEDEVDETDDSDGSETDDDDDVE